MSELSQISSQYDVLATTTDSLNDAIVSVKKYNIIHFDKVDDFSKLKLQADEYTLAKETIINFLSQFIDEKNVSMQSKVVLPFELVKDFKREVINPIAFFDNKALDLIGKLQSDSQINDEQFDLLDQIVSALDIRRTLKFKNLRAKRG